MQLRRAEVERFSPRLVTAGNETHGGVQGVGGCRAIGGHVRCLTDVMRTGLRDGDDGLAFPLGFLTARPLRGADFCRGKARRQ